MLWVDQRILLKSQSSSTFCVLADCVIQEYDLSLSTKRSNSRGIAVDLFVLGKEVSARRYLVPLASYLFALSASAKELLVFRICKAVKAYL